MALQIDYNPIYNEVHPDVRAEINERSRIYGHNTRGVYGTKFDWEAAKQSWCEVYYVDKKTKQPGDKPILGFGRDDNRFIDMYQSDYPIPKEPILEDVTISNQGTWGALQRADISFRVFTLDQLEKFEKDIIKPGSDIQIKYGWAVGRTSEKATTNKIHKKNLDPSQDTYKGITYNFNVEMNDDLTWSIKLQTVGEGYFLSGISANASSKVVDAKMNQSEHPRLVSDTNITIAYARGLSEKIIIDIADIGNVGGNFLSSNETKTIDNTELRYAARSLPIKYPKSKPKSNDTVNMDNELYSLESYPEALLPTWTVYIGLSDLIYYYTNAVAARSDRFGIGPDEKRVYMSANYGAWKNGNGNRIDLEEQYKFPYGVRSISIYDKEVVSCIPDTIFFNGGIDESDTYNSAHYNLHPNKPLHKVPGRSAGYDNGYFRMYRGKDKSGGTFNTQFQRVDTPDFCNLGEILISTDFVLDILESISDINNTQEKTIFNLFTIIFDKISYASGGLYKLGFIMEEIIGDNGKYISWYNLIDLNFTYTQHGGLKPLRFSTHDDTKPIVRSINFNLNVPNSMANALYVEGRFNMNDVTGESGAILGSLYSDAIKDDKKLADDINNRRKKALYFLRHAKHIMGKIGVTRTSILGLYNTLKEYRETPPENTTLHQYNSYLAQTIYPLELTITIDGISGFRFGNVIEVDGMPSRYYNEDGKAKVIFILTKVDHKITPHDWTTTLETQCRGNMLVKK